MNIMKISWFTGTCSDLQIEKTCGSMKLILNAKVDENNLPIVMQLSSKFLGMGSSQWLRMALKDAAAT
jgi:hypothetical protein